MIDASPPAASKPSARRACGGDGAAGQPVLTAVPLDPYDGPPVRCKKLPVGYVVYSMGTVWNDQGERSGSAITLTVER